MPESADDEALLADLRAGDEQAFASIVDAWSGGMRRVARNFVSTPDSANEVVQDTWLAVIAGLDRFEGRSSVKTWVFRILINTAKRRGSVERRTMPMSSLTGEDTGPTVDPERFQQAGEPYPHHWREFPVPWPSPEQAMLDSELLKRVRDAVNELPERQRIVITLRDIEGYDSAEVSELLDITAANQRVLLHRARAAVRGRIEAYVVTPTPKVPQ